MEECTVGTRDVVEGGRESGRNTVALLFFKLTWDRLSVGAADCNNNTIPVFLAREQGRPRCTAGFDGGERK